MDKEGGTDVLRKFSTSSRPPVTVLPCREGVGMVLLSSAVRICSAVLPGWLAA